MRLHDYGKPQTCLMDIDRSTEFTGDDVDQYSNLVDLGGFYENVQVFIPTIDSATVSLAVQKTGAVTEVPLPFYDWNDSDADGDVLKATTAATTTHVVTFKGVHCQYLRVKTSNDQTADRTFYVRGC